MSKLKLVVSDFHIGEGRYFKDGTKNILEDFQFDESFIAFLVHYSSGEHENEEVELIINGDFLNLLQAGYKGIHTYVMTERMICEGLERIIRSHERLFDALKNFAQKRKHSIAYIVGNHDQGVLFQKVQEIFSRAVGGNVRFYSHYYEFDGVRVEHGHMHEWVSRMDLERWQIVDDLPEPILNLPWGSVFVAEILPRIKMERPYVDKVKPFRRLLFWMIFFDTFFALKTASRVIKFGIDTFFLKGKYRFFDIKGSIKSLIKSITIYPDFDREAYKILMERDDIFTIIMGHTHVLRYRRYRQGKEYYNIGTWNEATSLNIGSLGSHMKLTYGLIEYPEQRDTTESGGVVHDIQSYRPKIKLREWKGYWSPEIDAHV